MKRWNNLWDSIMDVDNLRLAFWKASRGKRQLKVVRDFSRDLEASIQQLREQVGREHFSSGGSAAL